MDCRDEMFSHLKQFFKKWLHLWWGPTVFPGCQEVDSPATDGASYRYLSVDIDTKASRRDQVAFERDFQVKENQSTLHLIGADKYSLKSSSEPSPAVCNLVIFIIPLSCSNLFSDFKSLLLVFTFPLPLRAWGHCHDRHLSNFMSRCSKPKMALPQIPHHYTRPSP